MGSCLAKKVSACTEGGAGSTVACGPTRVRSAGPGDMMSLWRLEQESYDFKV